MYIMYIICIYIYNIIYSNITYIYIIQSKVIRAVDDGSKARWRICEVP